ncbi:MAG TPA: nicotinate-nucleotide--dimethylbenzimidazole phosphoribosyltransferase [Burkholderiaceae bacterium]|nr:nicotinate-nucleotide--dimethylbenzimidazole phosphoribosyltransferase [Burkholderiaceae bacterium]
MPLNRTLIAPTFHPPLEQALRHKLARRTELGGGLGMLEPLAVRLGLIRNSLKPRLHDPQLVVFSADHGLAVDGLLPPGGPTTAQQVAQLLCGQVPLGALASLHGWQMTVVDSGLADVPPRHPRLLARKIAHGTRNSRVGAAMSFEQAQAAIRAGMEIADALPGNVLACAGHGVGSEESAMLLLALLAGLPPRELAGGTPGMDPQFVSHRLMLLDSVLARHPGVHDPIEALAAVGGHEIAMMVGAILIAAGRRSLVVVDGLPACAALWIASRIASPVVDYCAFARSHARPGLARVLRHFQATALLDLGMDTLDGTGAVLAWPLVRSAAALLTEVAEGEEPGPTHPTPL